MSICFEKARELGNLIMSSEQADNVKIAQNNFANNPTTKKAYENFVTFQDELLAKIDSNQISDDERESEVAKLQNIYESLQNDPVAQALTLAESKFNEFANQILDILKQTIGAEAPTGGCEGCSSSGGDCSGCN